VRVLLLNTDRDNAFEVAAGDRIAQLLVVAFAAVAVLERDALEATERDVRGFGSSG
jgi:dUTP pyrophosphatase